MSRADLHLHSRYSVSSSEYLIRMMQLNESYTEIGTLYSQAKARGMDFVTVTDHDTIDGALELVDRFPGDTFVSVEVTARFPEDGCKAHILVYGLDETQFGHIQAIRGDIYELRDYLVGEDLAHSLAHATYDMDGVLKLQHLQKFMLLFNVFEGCNGGRNRDQNVGWVDILGQLTPGKIDELYSLHRIEPTGPAPWRKGITGGSDDHAGLFIGTSWTTSNARDVYGFLDELKSGETGYGGKHGNFRKMAFSFYKILYDHTGANGGPNTSSRIQMFNNLLFERRKPGLRDRIRLNRGRRHPEQGTRMLAQLLSDISIRFTGRHDSLIDDADVEWLYTRLSRYLDQYFSHMLGECVEPGNTTRSFSAISKLLSFLPVPLLSMPFIATSKIIFTTSGLIHEAQENLYGMANPGDKSVLWFSDTIVDLNGVTETLKLFGNGARDMGLNLALAVCVPQDQRPPELPENTLYLPPVHSQSSEIYSSYTVHFPSLLDSLRQVCDRNPREIIVSTPGPMGFLGLVAARVLGIPCRSIYHTDFKVQLELIVGQGMAPVIADQFCRAFYAATDEIQVPSRTYVEMLEQRGYPRDRLSLFARGLEDHAFGFNPGRRDSVMTRHRIDPGRFTLLWAGRVSHDKNIDFLLDRFRDICKRSGDAQLVFAGDGPALDHYLDQTRDMAGVHWLGRLGRDELRDWYSAADLLVFPSTMDTFGMVVLEAQAAGLPAIVTDIGGPQEIVDNGTTGYVLSLAEPKAWTLHVCTLMHSRRANAAGWSEKRHEISRRTSKQCNLRKALSGLMKIDIPAQAPEPSPARVIADERRLEVA